MTTSPHFGFLDTEWPELHLSAAKAEELANTDPRTSCFYARRTLELAVQWLYTHDGTLRVPYQDHLAALIHEPSFRDLLGPTLHAKVRVIKDVGNLAVHSTKSVRSVDAVAAVRELFHVCYWLARTYARTGGGRPAPGVMFDAAKLPKRAEAPAQTLAQVQSLKEELAARDSKLTELLAGRAALDEELARLRAEIAAAKRINDAIVDTHDYSEAQTRDYFIDLLLKEAGWPLDQARDREFEIAGMPNQQGNGFVDYVLWGDDGKPLGLVEAKRTMRDARVGQQQAKLYADCLEKQFGQRPVIFYSNGYEHWLWDDSRYPPRSVQGFLKKDELQLLIQRRSTRQPLASAEISNVIVERYYQSRAIRRIAESFERDHLRKALLVMATGAGKTRTVIALADLLMRCNWAKRVLFLADRVALVNQAVNAFRVHLQAAPPVNLVTEKSTQGRVYVSTYPTMMGLIDETQDGHRRFGVGHFDLIVIDEAHRSVYQKYGAIFDYFDSLLVGLTATPKDEVDRNTYRLFELETGVPTDVYDIDDAVRDGFLVPPKAVSVPLKFQREGIRYDDLSEDDKDAWDALEWSDEGDVPDRVEAAAVNRWLFNKDTVDKVLAHLMTRGLKVAGGDRLGKTIIFAKNQQHADFIQERFNANYPHYHGHFARVITFKTEYAQSLIDDFSQRDKAPHIAISVDMLDTGIDVPEVVNLVFFKLVRSKTKFWQMLGRGTRLCPNLFGTSVQKEFFYVFDYCQNLEFFSQNPETVEGAAGVSIGKRLFLTRLEFVAELDKMLATTAQEGTQFNESGLRDAVSDLLHSEVASMKLDNFVVRPHRRAIEKYAERTAWNGLTVDDRGELRQEVAGLPSELEDTDVDAKQFDLLILRLQLAVLRSERRFKKLKEEVQQIAGALSEKDAIPMVRAQMALIQEVMTEAYWQNITAPLLEQIRKRLRSLIKLIDRAQRPPVYTDFPDEMGEDSEIDLPGLAGRGDFERFREKARHFLKQHATHVTIHKLRRNQPLTASDLSELERMLIDAGIGTVDDVERAKMESEGLGLFVRSLIGLDREAAKQALNKFLLGKTLNADQIEFVTMIIDHLVTSGTLKPDLLYESPYRDFHSRGVDGVFSSAHVTELIAVLEDVRRRAIA